MTTYATHSNGFSYAPLDSTGAGQGDEYNQRTLYQSGSPERPNITMTDSSYFPSSPPPLYSDSQRHGSNSPPRGGSPPRTSYRPESMLYAKNTPMHSPSLSATSEASSAALLSSAERDAEKASISPAHDEEETSYQGYGQTSRSLSRSPSPGGHTTSHVRGKRFPSFFRSIFAFFNIILSLLTIVLIGIVLSIYSSGKNKSVLPGVGPGGSKPPANIPPTYAFPQDINPLPINLIVGSSAFAFVFSITAILAPCWRSNKKFHKKRFAKSELIEILGNLIIVGAGAAAVYFSFDAKTDVNTGLWAYSCAVSKDTAKYQQTKLFPGVNYSNACGNYESSFLVKFANAASRKFLNPMRPICTTKKNKEEEK
ncbi:hypothetical protein H072_10077 [Dactylellina haptotyla CBS 200.50]|uniref:Uncharacterized protein n=1 Tax=Dactylellina haptotyla (strain CBS 200.50) TaxID=1284197 RepID=S8BMF5_DACHA|nr:hypothetical protein H072_10077 [Dactylellina haptotyla CBS 200.50]